MGQRPCAATGGSRRAGRPATLAQPRGRSQLLARSDIRDPSTSSPSRCRAAGRGPRRLLGDRAGRALRPAGAAAPCLRRRRFARRLGNRARCTRARHPAAVPAASGRPVPQSRRRHRCSAPGSRSARGGRPPAVAEAVRRLLDDDRCRTHARRLADEIAAMPSYAEVVAVSRSSRRRSHFCGPATGAALRAEGHFRHRAAVGVATACSGRRTGRAGGAASARDAGARSSGAPACDLRWSA